MPSTAQTDRLLTVADAAERLGIAVAVVLAHIRAGRLRASNVGLGSVRPRWRIRGEDLEEFLAARQVARPVAPTRRRNRQTTAGVIEFFR